MLQLSRRQSLGAMAALLAPFRAFSTNVSSEPATPAVDYIVPFAPAGFAFLTASLVARQLNECPPYRNRVHLKIVPGASGALGAQQAQATKDGACTLLQATGAHLAMKDFPGTLRAISVVAETPLVFCVNSASPIRSYQDLQTELRRPDASIVAGSTGVGTPSHIALQEMAQGCGPCLKTLRFYDYGGTSLAIFDLLANNLDLFVSNLPECAPYIRQGWLRGLVITSPERFKYSEDAYIPGTNALEVPSLNLVNWTAIMRSPAEPVDKVGNIEERVQDVVRSDGFKDALARCDLAVRGLDSGESGNYLEARKSDRETRLSRLPELQKIPNKT